MSIYMKQICVYVFLLSSIVCNASQQSTALSPAEEYREWLRAEEQVSKAREQYYMYQLSKVRAHQKKLRRERHRQKPNAKEDNSFLENDKPHNNTDIQPTVKKL